MILNAHKVRIRLRTLLREDVPLRFTQHSRSRMVERRVTEAEVIEILYTGWCDESSTETNAYGEASYRITTQRAYVVIKFEEDPDGILVITVVVLS